MKKIYFFMLIEIIFINLNGQEFAPVGASWHYTEGQAFLPYVDYFRLESVKDTIIDEVPCKMIMKNKVQQCSTRPYIEFMFKNDSNEVYFYDENINSFQKLWDFGAEKGGSWNILIPDNDTISYYVDSVSEIIINGNALRELYVSYEFQGYEYFYTTSRIIENIGDINYFFPWNNPVCDDNYAEGLRCYEDTIIGFYSTGIADSCTYSTWPVAIKEPGNYQPQITISPNPAKDEITLTLENIDGFYYTLIDLKGNELLSDFSINSSAQINIRNLQSGFYLLIVKFCNTNVYQKFIKI